MHYPSFFHPTEFAWGCSRIRTILDVVVTVDSYRIMEWAKTDKLRGNLNWRNPFSSCCWLSVGLDGKYGAFWPVRRIGLL